MIAPLAASSGLMTIEMLPEKGPFGSGAVAMRYEPRR